MIIKNIKITEKNLIKIDIRIRSSSVKLLLKASKIDGNEILKLKNNKLEILIILNFLFPCKTPSNVMKNKIKKLRKRILDERSST